ncbi:MAG: hypothetical protein IKQ70_10405 [Bacteroidales bacterium]|nr:hypothetical protein [Bacteroidales bacterium]
MQNLKDTLQQSAQYLCVSIPYDKDDRPNLISFDAGLMTELECDDDFTPPTLNPETQLLEYLINLKTGKVENWNYEEGYLRMWAKVRDSGTYTLLDADKKPIWQICGYVPNHLLPPYEKGFGDYIELAVNSDGTINGWRETLDFSEFITDGKFPEPVKTYKWHRVKELVHDIMSKKLSEEEMERLRDELRRM